MVDHKVMVGVITQEYSRRADFYDYFYLLKKPENGMVIFCHDRSPAKARNLIIEAALEHKCTHILFIDDDMVFDPDSLYKLLSHDKDIVTGLYLTRSYPHQPLIFDIADDTGACLYAYLSPEDSLLREIVAAGFGFLLVKTSIFEKMEKPYVRLGELDSEQWCDDIGFFNRVRKAGIRSYCDMDCCLGHIGTVIVRPEKTPNGWVTSYDTGGSGKVATPQFNPALAMK